MTKDNRTIKTTNPFSGQSTMLTPEEYKLYIMIKQAEIDEDYKTVERGLPLNPEATMLWRMTFDNDNYVTGRKDFVVGPAIYINKHALGSWAN